VHAKADQKLNFRRIASGRETVDSVREGLVRFVAVIHEHAADASGNVVYVT